MSFATEVTSAAGGIAVYTTADGATHQTFLQVDETGHVTGTRPDYTCFFTPVTNALNLEVAEIFNAHATAIVRVRGIWVMPTNTSITGCQIGYDVNRISAVGSTGSTTETPRPLDTNAAAVPAGITCRRGSTAGATLTYKYWTQYVWNDELSPGTAMIPVMNQLPVLGDRVTEIVLRPSQGVQVKIGQVTGTAAGLTGALIYFVVDN